MGPTPGSSTHTDARPNAHCLYRRLGVARDASVEVIRKAYWSAAKQFHSDLGGSDTSMKRLNEAWEILRCPKLRSNYDRCVAAEEEARERMSRARADQERAARDRAERERADRERAERAAYERERAERERADRERAPAGPAPAAKRPSVDEWLDVCLGIACVWGTIYLIVWLLTAIETGSIAEGWIEATELVIVAPIGALLGALCVAVSLVLLVTLGLLLILLEMRPNARR